MAVLLIISLILFVLALVFYAYSLNTENKRFKQRYSKLDDAEQALKITERKLRATQSKVKQIFERYGEVLSKQDVIESLELDVADLKKQELVLQKEIKLSNELVDKQSLAQTLKSRISSLEGQELSLQEKITRLSQTLKQLEEADELYSNGFYQTKYNFGTAEEYKDRLEQIRGRQKEMLKEKKAAICKTEWTVEGSAEKGRKMMNDYIKLILRAFNGECDSAVLKVKYNNASSLENRILKTYEILNKLARTNQVEIANEFLQLKLNEMYLVHEYQEKKQEEKEEQRLIREQIREEERAQKEFKKIEEEAKKEEEQYLKALEEARQEVLSSDDPEKEKLQEKVDALLEQLEKAQENKERAISRAQTTKSGHVYIISNIGSFGKNVYKIGMTRRLEPLDRVKELSGASVPFPFDVHAMLFSENAPELEHQLHIALNDNRVNKANERKEFFKVSLEEIIQLAKQLIPGTEVKVMKIAEAEEYHKTLAMENE